MKFVFPLLALGILFPMASLTASALTSGDKVVCRNETNQEVYAIEFVSKTSASVQIYGRPTLEGDEIRFYPATSVVVAVNQNGNYQVDMHNFDGSNILESLEFPSYLDFGGDGYGTYISLTERHSVFCALK